MVMHCHCGCGQGSTHNKHQAPLPPPALWCLPAWTSPQLPAASGQSRPPSGGPGGWTGSWGRRASMQDNGCDGRSTCQLVQRAAWLSTRCLRGCAAGPPQLEGQPASYHEWLVKSEGALGNPKQCGSGCRKCRKGGVTKVGSMWAPVSWHWAGACMHAPSHACTLTCAVTCTAQGVMRSESHARK